MTLAEVTQSSGWTTYATVLGLGAVIGAIVSALVNYFLTTRWQRRTWIDDNKKAEWRELIDVLNDCMDKMTVAFGVRAGPAADPDMDWNNARWRGTRILRDRIFIAEVVDKTGIEKAWGELVSYVVGLQMPRDERQQGGVPTMAGYVLHSGKLRDLLNSTARRDLGIEPGRTMWAEAMGVKDPVQHG